MKVSADDLETLVRYADQLREGTRHADAITAYQQALAFGAPPIPIEFALAALGVGPEPTLAPQDYVREHFDAFASGFDRHLTIFLRYRVPELLHAALLPWLPAQRIDMLELGCGTGLCAPLLRPLARRLIGVDLSECMLERARQSGHYDELVCGDVAEVANRHADAFDLVIAADVFVYVGDLVPVFAGVRAALRPGGLFAFSIESDEAAPFALQTTLRYTHSLAYVERLAHESGMVVRSAERHAIRQESKCDVPGDIVVLQRA